MTQLWTNFSSLTSHVAVSLSEYLIAFHLFFFFSAVCSASWQHQWRYLPTTARQLSLHRQPPLTSYRFHHPCSVFGFHHTCMFTCRDVWVVPGRWRVTAGVSQLGSASSPNEVVSLLLTAAPGGRQGQTTRSDWPFTSSTNLCPPLAHLSNYSSLRCTQ